VLDVATSALESEEEQRAKVFADVCNGLLGRIDRIQEEELRTEITSWRRLVEQSRCTTG
jgi:hypothetical protein